MPEKILLILTFGNSIIYISIYPYIFNNSNNRNNPYNPNMLKSKKNPTI